MRHYKAKRCFRLNWNYHDFNKNFISSQSRYQREVQIVSDLSRKFRISSGICLSYFNLGLFLVDSELLGKPLTLSLWFKMAFMRNISADFFFLNNRAVNSWPASLIFPVLHMGKGIPRSRLPTLEHVTLCPRASSPTIFFFLFFN